MKNTIRIVASLVIGTWMFWVCPPCFNKMLWGSILALFFILINFQNFFARFRILVQAARVLVGLLFIFSGLVKENDTVGFSY